MNPEIEHWWEVIKAAITHAALWFLIASLVFTMFYKILSDIFRREPPCCGCCQRCKRAVQFSKN